MLRRIDQKNSWVPRGKNFPLMDLLPGSLLYLFSSYSHFRNTLLPRTDFFFLQATHSKPVKPELPNIAGSKEGKILSCLTFCKRHRQISEVNHHEWSHLRVRPATSLCGWITRQSESPSEETAGGSLSALSPFMTRLTVSAPFTGMSCLAKRNR